MVANNQELTDFLSNKSDQAKMLFEYFTDEFKTIGNDVSLHPAKTMIGVSNAHKRIAWITQFGKGFIHIVFPFKQAYPDNLCFIKIAQVPGDENQFNHHFRMTSKEDLNEEVMSFMKLAYREEAS